MQYISNLGSNKWLETDCRKLVILGSTGSIGKSALDVCEKLAHRFEIVALAGGQNVELLTSQALKFKPKYLAVQNEDSAKKLQDNLKNIPNYNPEISFGQEAYCELASLEEIDTVLSSQVGAVGLRATISAVLASKVVCLANKESLVLAGTLIRDLCAKTGATILPVDSEHNAIFQLIQNKSSQHIKKIILTASGGPFRTFEHEQLRNVKASDALKHPTWSMGAKISIDSATLMNKGLEILEAHFLYGLESDKIDVVVHPQSIIHSLVEFNDGSSTAQLSIPDMRLPIAHCLNFPHCEAIEAKVLDLASFGSLTFEKPNLHSFKCLSLARRAMIEKGAQAIVLNAANEIAVEAFLKDQISFFDIANLCEKMLDNNLKCNINELEEILALDAQVRAMALEYIKNI